MKLSSIELLFISTPYRRLGKKTEKINYGKSIEDFKNMINLPNMNGQRTVQQKFGVARQHPSYTPWYMENIILKKSF